MDEYLQYMGGTVGFGLAAVTGAAAATALYMAYSPTPTFPPVDIYNQSLEVPVCIKPLFLNHSPLWRSHIFVFFSACLFESSIFSH